MTIEQAREIVADWWVQNAHDVRTENAYASHVTEDQKKADFARRISLSEEIRAGKMDHVFHVRQDLHYAMTGECVPLLP